MSLLRATRLSQHRVCLLQSQSARVQTLAFSTSVSRSAGKESTLHEDSDKRAEDVEKTKHEQLKAQKEGTNKFTPELASDSEEAVKADRHDVDHADKSIEKMQKETEGHASEKHNQ